LALLAAALTLIVIAKGAYVRLSHAGLGCPDWPGCYGHLTWPDEAKEIASANTAHPERPVEVGKAWREMVHRYLASLLGLIIVGLGYVAWRDRADPRVPLVASLVLVPLVIFQGLLGKWTVTELVKPAIVTAHLLGGISVFALLIWVALRYAGTARSISAPALRRFTWIAIAILSAQIFLGGWTSTNYAALACPDFPTCQQQWWPEANFHEGFVLWRGLGVDYEGGVLDSTARVAIHLSHRIGAIIASIVLALLAICLWRRGQRLSAVLLLSALAAQIALGISNIVYGLPISVATAHTAVAALLMASLMFCLHRVSPAQRAT
jgi:heme a synthase